jgi:hypothetical protein
MTVDLRIPYSRRVLIVPPESMSAGSLAEVVVYAVEPGGQPADASQLVLRSSGTKVHPLGSRVPGEARFLVAAPTVLKERKLRLMAQVRGQNTTVVPVQVPLLPGQAAGLSLEPEATHFERGKASSMRVFLGAEDAYGNLVDPRRASLIVDGRPAEVKEDPSGAPVAIASTPDGKADEVTVEGVLDKSHAVRRIPVGAKQRVQKLRRQNRALAPLYTLSPRIGVLWNLAYQVGGTLFIDAAAYRSARYPGLGLGLSLGLLETWFPAQSAGGISRTTLSTFPLLFQIRQHIVSGRSYLAVGAGAGFAVSFARVNTYGASLHGHSFGAAAEAGFEIGFLLKDAHLFSSLRYMALLLDDFSSGDRIAGNAGGAIADIGYRIVW